MMSSSKSGFHFYICGYWGVLLVAKVSKVVFIFGYCAMCAMCIGQSTKREKEREDQDRTGLAYQRRCRPTQQIFVQN